MSTPADFTATNGQDTASFVPTKQSSKYERLGSLDGERKAKTNYYAIACALLASMNSVLLGYDIGVISGAILFIKADLKIHEFQEEVLVSSLNVVSLFGGAVAGRFADALGRRWTMALAAFVFLVGAAGMGLAPSYDVLMISRLLAGFGVGLALMVAPVYTAELAPASCRGALVSLPEIFINIGILLGYVANYAFSGLPLKIGWRIMLGIGTIPAVMLALGVMFMPESPRWLVMQDRLWEAKAILAKTSEDEAEADRRLQDIIEAAGLKDSSTADKYRGSFQGEEDSNTADPSPRRRNDGEGIWRELMCPIPAVRRMLVVAAGIQFFQQATGIDATVYYSPEVFKHTGIGSNAGVIAATLAVGFTKCIFILVAVLYLDRVGRRRLLMISTSGITLSLVSLAFSFLFVHDKGGVLTVLVIVFICCYVALFSVGIGPVCWVLTTEIFPLRLRAQAMSLGIVINRVVSAIVSLTFLSLARAITYTGIYFLFTGVSLLSMTFVYFCVPETKGKSLEEVAKFFCGDDSEGLSALCSIELGDHSVEEENKHLNASTRSTQSGFVDDEDTVEVQGSSLNNPEKA